MQFDNPTDLLDRIESGQVAPEDALEDAIRAYRILALDIKMMEVDQRRAKEIIIRIMQDTGAVKVVSAGGTAQFSGGGVRVSYDVAALDALCASSREVAILLAPHRKETPIKASLIIKAE